ncbi:activator of SKN7 protein 10 [Monosporozyma unispora]|nr:hypothetical protein C6P44_004827 [Kazachstania unispora]
MSDYFSVKPIPSENNSNNNSQNNTPNNDSQNRLTVNNPNNSHDDLRSIHSSQYLMDILPDNVSVVQNTIHPSMVTSPSMISNTTAPTGYPSTANFNAGGNNSIVNNNYILPKSDERSPYYVSVPIPNPNAKGQKSISGKKPLEGGDDNEEYFVREYPTDILMDRFHKWKKILKGLIGYLREVAYSQEQFARINTQLKSSVKFHFLTDIEEGTNRLVDPFTTTKPMKKQQPKTLAQKKLDSSQQQQSDEQNTSTTGVNGGGDTSPYLSSGPIFNEESYEQDILATSGFMKFGSGSIQDIQVVLKKHHLSLASQQLKISKEISTVLIPKLESLRKDLNFKIKEIKELHNDFKTNMNQHLDVTQKLLHKYIASVKYMNAITKKDNPAKLADLQPKHDPYLLKLQLDLQLKKQIAEENYLQDAYINLQSSGMKLEKIIYSKIQHAMQRYSALIDSEARLTIKNLCHELQQGILSKPPAIEWDHFVNHHPTCLINWRSNDPLPLPRKISEIVYPNMKTSFAKCIRAGYFYKKSNYSKEYKKGYFVLTPNYLHEFKSSNFYETGNNQSFTVSPNITPVSTPGATPGTMTPNGMTPIHQHHPQQHTSLTPILSIPLNDASLNKVSEHHFTLKGKAIFIEPIRKIKTPSAVNSHSSSFANLTTTASNAALSTATAATKNTVLSKKSPFSKLLNPGKSKQLKQEQQKRLAELQQETSIKEQESKNIVTWIFKSCNDEDTETGHRHFKKWVQDLKNLTTFNTTNERMQYIEEKLWKNHLNRSSRMIQIPSGSSVPTMSDYNGQAHSMETSSSTVHLMEMSMRRNNKPQYIAINNTPMLSQEASFRSKMNTPAIDDNGNLITMAERKNYSFSPNSGVQTPAFSPNYSSMSDISSMANNEHSTSPAQKSQQQQQQQQQVPPTVVTPTGANVTKHHHQRNISLPVSLGQVNAVNSPASVISDGSGYFGIPVQRGSSEQLQMTVTPPLSRTTSRGTASIHRVPKVKVNNQEVKDNTSSIRPPITENSSTGSLPSLTKENTNEFYQRANSSATNLTATQTSRVHPIRKHKKNVSFSSLNSLMFAKKGGTSAAFTGKQLMGDGIREDDDDDDGDNSSVKKLPADDNKIKLNQSLYS